MITLQWLVILLCCAAVCSFLGARMIAANLYHKMIQDHEGKKSPYGLVITKNNKNEFGYSITKNGNIIKVPNSSQYPVYRNIPDAISYMNVLEKLEGYALTTLDEESNNG